jgi:hypothetical protein
MTDERHRTTALEGAARRRRALREALAAFEDAISSPIRDREAWRVETTDALQVLSRAFGDHVVETEAAGGLYEEMQDTAPHLGAKANRLRDEHPLITASLAEAGARLGEALADEEAVDALRDDLLRLMGRIVRHRQHGADLVWEAYAVDIGESG